MAGIAIGISHGLGPGVRRKCDASPQTREFLGELRQLFQQLFQPWVPRKVICCSA
ncbi:hypothetical protein SynMEDNS5_00837 [Synechococcus sp. MEDNS5]|nr:hypothetical protein SynMEDNS5_00837 [Synechococcus sp. MEDNS5]